MSAEDSTFVHWDANCYTAVVEQIPRVRFGAFRQYLASRSARPNLTQVNLLELSATRASRKRKRLLQAAGALAYPEILRPPEYFIRHAIALAAKDRVLLDGVCRQFDPIDHSSPVANRASNLIRHRRLSSLPVTADNDVLRLCKSFEAVLHVYIRKGPEALLRSEGAAVPRSEIGVAEGAELFRGIASRARQGTSPIQTSGTEFLLRARQATVALLIAGHTPFRGYIDEMWASLGLESASEKSSYLRGVWSTLEDNAVLTQLFGMLAHQARKKRKSAGNLLDLLQLPYLLLGADWYTRDAEIIRYSKRLPAAKRRAQVKQHQALIDGFLGRGADFD